MARLDHHNYFGFPWVNSTQELPDQNCHLCASCKDMITIPKTGNTGVIDYLTRSGLDPVTVVPESDAAGDPYTENGSHPDIVWRVWNELGVMHENECRVLVCGVPVLIDSEGLILAIALGTTYALRVPAGELDTALALGAKQVHRYESVEVELNVGQKFGDNWIFGFWHDDELTWCSQKAP